MKKLLILFSLSLLLASCNKNIDALLKELKKTNHAIEHLLEKVKSTNDFLKIKSQYIDYVSNQLKISYCILDKLSTVQKKKQFENYFLKIKKGMKPFVKRSNVFPGNISEILKNRKKYINLSKIILKTNKEIIGKNKQLYTKRAQLFLKIKENYTKVSLISFGLYKIEALTKIISAENVLIKSQISVTTLLERVIKLRTNYYKILYQICKKAVNLKRDNLIYLKHYMTFINEKINALNKYHAKKQILKKIKKKLKQNLTPLFKKLATVTEKIRLIIRRNYKAMNKLDE